MIGIDWHGTLVNEETYKRELLDRQGLAIPGNMLCSRATVVDQLGLMTHDQWTEFTHEVYTTGEDIPWRPGARELVEHWTGHYVILTNGLPEFSEGITASYQHQGLPVPEIVTLGVKYGSNDQRRMKREVMSERGLVALIDNQASNLAGIPGIPIHVSTTEAPVFCLNPVSTLYEADRMLRTKLPQHPYPAHR